MADSRKKVSIRRFVDATGAVVKDIEKAVGAQYELHGGKTFNVTESSVGKAGWDMLAIFGAHTKLGNEANSVLNDKDAPGSADDASAQIEEFLANLADGVWSVPGQGGFAKVDRDALATAIMAVAVQSGKATDGDAAKLAEYRAKLDADPKWFQAVRKVPAIAAEYSKAVGAKEVSVEDVLG